MKKHNRLKHFARELRSNGTLGEAILWKEVLRARQFYGLQWNRQFTIDKFIVDFICRKLKLIIELDGKYHDLISSQDQERDKELLKLGYRVIRISEQEVIQDVNSVYHYLKKYVPEEIKMKWEKENQSP